MRFTTLTKPIVAIDFHLFPFFSSYLLELVYPHTFLTSFLLFSITNDSEYEHKSMTLSLKVTSGTLCRTPKKNTYILLVLDEEERKRF